MTKEDLIRLTTSEVNELVNRFQLNGLPIPDDLVKLNPRNLGLGVTGIVIAGLGAYGLYQLHLYNLNLKRALDIFEETGVMPDVPSLFGSGSNLTNLLFNPLMLAIIAYLIWKKGIK